MQHALSAGSEPNPHVLAALTRAGETCTIVATQDIVDARGVQLWLAGQPVSAALQSKLLERRLRKPLELCFQAESGITLDRLKDELQAFLDSSHPLTHVVRPRAAQLQAQLPQLSLHPVAQLLLTIASATRPHALTHAVAGLLLAGTMMASTSASEADIQLAMLGGLLHDLGEVYIPQQYLDYTQPLGLLGHKHLVVHPRVGQTLLSTLTDYPAALTRAIGEHHERLDRSGYPARLGDEISPLGRLLAVMEATLGSIHTPHAPLARAGFALRAVPGEFDDGWAAFIVEAARAAEESLPPESLPPAADFASQLADIDRQLADTRRLAKELHEQKRTSKITGVVNDALRRLERLSTAWQSLGLGTAPADDPRHRLKLQHAEAELRHRMRNFHRECLLLADGLTETEKLRLTPLWQGLLDGRYSRDSRELPGP